MDAPGFVHGVSNKEEKKDLPTQSAPPECRGAPSKHPLWKEGEKGDRKM